jgi:acetylornithine/N-succinyldiaminopimelate aminotransferase
LLERAEELGAYFQQRFEALRSRCPLIREVRVKGVMIGIELTVDGAPVVKGCLERRLLINCTHSTVLRLLPALTLSDAERDEGCDILEAVLLNLNQTN